MNATVNMYESPVVEVVNMISEGMICGSDVPADVTVGVWGNGGSLGNQEIK